MKCLIILIPALFLLLNFVYGDNNDRNFSSANYTKLISERLSEINTRETNAIAGKEIKFKLDSMIISNVSATNGQMQPSMKIDFIYDDEGRVISETGLMWNVDSLKWIPLFSHEFVLNTAGQTVCSTSLFWDQYSSVWFYSARDSSTYDANGNQTKRVSYFWDMLTQAWKGSEISEYGYDANGNEVLYTDYYWNETINNWEGTYRNETNYDSSGKKILQLTYHWDAVNSIWEKSEKDEYTYNSGGLNEYINGFIWDTATEDWSYGAKQYYTYNSEGKRLSNSISYYDEATLTWIEQWREEYSYNDKGQIVAEVYYSKNIETGAVISQGKTEYSYDEKGNTVIIISSDWNASINDWEGREKQVFTYNLEIASEEIASSEQYGLWSMISSVDNFQKYPGATDWVAQSSIDFYYSNFNGTVDVESLGKSNFKVYPNPADEFIILEPHDDTEMISLTIFDLRGNKLFREKFKGQQKITLGFLNSGVYVYSVVLSNKTINGKIIVR
jgi:hypothetical protein